MKRYKIYTPTNSELVFAQRLSDGIEDSKYVVCPENGIYGFLAEIAYNNIYGRYYDWVGINEEYRWDFIHKETKRTIDCKAKPVKIFPPPLGYHSGLFDLGHDSFGKCDIYVMAAVTDMDLFKTVRVALVGWEYAKEYFKTAKLHPAGSQPPGFYNPLEYPCYEKEYRDLRRFNGSPNT